MTFMGSTSVLPSCLVFLAHVYKNDSTFNNNKMTRIIEMGALLKECVKNEEHWYNMCFLED